ncbi:MAG: hypothetical protein ACI8ZN_000503 [Bacteroidia bacterium]|jgi:hypothetical protein
MFLLLSGLMSMGQTTKIEVAKFETLDGKRARNNARYEIFKSKSNLEEFYVVETARESYGISTYSTKTMERLSGYNVEEPSDGNREPQWIKYLFHEGNLTMVYAIFNKKLDTYTVYGKIVDDAGQSVTDETVLMEIEARKKKDVGGIVLRLSEDETQLLLLREPPGGRFEREKLELALFDRDLNKQYEDAFSFPYKYKSLYLEDIKISNLGEIIIVCNWEQDVREVRKSRSSKTKAASTKVTKIFSVNVDEEDLREIELEQKGYSFTDMNGYVLNEPNIMVFTGFYREMTRNASRRDQFKGANGIYYIVLDLSTMELVTRNYDTFSDEQLAEIFAASVKKKKANKIADKGFGLSSYYIRNMFYTEDGKVAMVLEKSYVVEHCNTNQNGQTTCTYTYYDMELLEVHVDEDGKIFRTRVIPKKQISRSSSGGSGNYTGLSIGFGRGAKVYWHGSVVLENEGKLFYVFNDAEKNFSNKRVKPGQVKGFGYPYSTNRNGFGPGKKRLAVAYYSNEEDELAKDPLTSSFKTNISIHPKSACRISNDVVITWCDPVKGKGLSLVKIYLD